MRPGLDQAHGRARAVKVGRMSEGPAPETVTQLLVEWQKGDQNALDRLLPLVYAELRTIAGRYLSRESPGHTLQSTASVLSSRH